MKNALTGILFLLVSIIILGGTSCVRYKTVSTHTRDTIFVKQTDTTTIYLEDKSAPKIDTVFQEIEKDCPSLPKEKVNISHGKPI